MKAKSRPDPTRARVRARLLRWYRRHGRDLPWRRTRDPYQIAVSEFMLQQTQVSRVEGYYRQFLERFPTIHDLAEAPIRAVREAWEGLGYYRRAHNLHRLAQEVVETHAGVVPRTPERLRQLPGIGRYTAGAIAVFAYEQRSAAVDTNVARVIRRAFHPRLARTTAAEDRLWATAEQLLPRRGRDAWTFNQAIMELGAVVCTARVMKCEICPVRRECVTGAKGATGAKRAIGKT